MMTGTKKLRVDSIDIRDEILFFMGVVQEPGDNRTLVFELEEWDRDFWEDASPGIVINVNLEEP